MEKLDRPRHRPPAGNGYGQQHRSAPRPVTPRLDSAMLFTTGREVIIEHGEAEYRLRITSQGKLILTK